MVSFTSLSWLDSSVLVLMCETRGTRTRYVGNFCGLDVSALFGLNFQISYIIPLPHNLSLRK